MAQTNIASKVSQAEKVLRVQITISLEKYPNGEVYCFASDGFIDGPVIAGDDAQKFADLLSEKLGAEVFFDPDKLPY